MQHSALLALSIHMQVTVYWLGYGVYALCAALTVSQLVFVLGFAVFFFSRASTRALRLSRPALAAVLDVRDGHRGRALLWHMLVYALATVFAISLRVFIEVRVSYVRISYNRMSFEHSYVHYKYSLYSINVPNLPIYSVMRYQYACPASIKY